MAQHTDQNNKNSQQAETPLGEIAQQALPVFQKMLEGMFDQVGQQASQQVASQFDARFTAFGDQQEALAADLGKLSEKFDQVLKQIHKDRETPLLQKVLSNVMDALGAAEGKHRKATNELKQGNLTAKSVEEFRSALKALTGGLAGAINRIQRLEERADETNERLGKHDQRIATLEQEGGSAHVQQLLALMRHVPGDGTDENPARLARIDDIESGQQIIADEVGTIQQRMDTTTGNVNNLMGTVYGFAATTTTPGKPGLRDVLGIDPNTGLATRLDEIERKLGTTANKVDDHSQQLNEGSGISFGRAASYGGAAAVITLLLLVALVAPLPTIFLVTAAAFLAVTGISHAIGKKVNFGKNKNQSGPTPTIPKTW